MRQYETTVEKMDQVNLKLPEKEQINTSQFMSTFEDLYYQVKAKEGALQADNPVVPQVREEQQPNPRISLPTINIPMFSGDVTRFPAFRSLFDQLIHNNKDLSDIQKFTYLKSYLSDSASSCIDHKQLASQNYHLAYRCVTERFGKKRVRANAYLSNLEI